MATNQVCETPGAEALPQALQEQFRFVNTPFLYQPRAILSPCRSSSPCSAA
jgi:hypothetical protein